MNSGERSEKRLLQTRYTDVKYTERCSTSFVTRKVLIKPIVMYHNILSRMA